MKGTVSKVALRVVLLAALIAVQTRAEVGEALQGAASIISAVSPIATAAAEASAAKAVAASNGYASVATAAIQADTSKYLANIQAETALAQTMAAAEISRINNEGQTERLGMQLAELRAAREDSMRAEREKRMMELEYNRERIDLAKKQAEDNYKLAQATLQAQLVQAGLVSGIKYQDSSKGLTVTRTLSTNSAASLPANTVAAANTAMQPSQTAFTGPRSETTRRLLAAATSGGKLSRTTAVTAASAVPSLTQGSTPFNKYRAAAPKTSDLTNFRVSLGVGEPRANRAPASVEAPVIREGGHRGAAGY